MRMYVCVCIHTYVCIVIDSCFCTWVYFVSVARAGEVGPEFSSIRAGCIYLRTMYIHTVQKLIHTYIYLITKSN